MKLREKKPNQVKKKSKIFNAVDFISDGFEFVFELIFDLISDIFD
jgi:hypothetical protein